MKTQGSWAGNWYRVVAGYSSGGFNRQLKILNRRSDLPSLVWTTDGILVSPEGEDVFIAYDPIRKISYGPVDADGGHSDHVQRPIFDLAGKKLAGSDCTLSPPPKATS